MSDPLELGSHVNGTPPPENGVRTSHSIETDTTNDPLIPQKLWLEVSFMFQLYSSFQVWRGIASTKLEILEPSFLHVGMAECLLASWVAYVIAGNYKMGERS